MTEPISLRIEGGERLLAKLRSGFHVVPVRTALERSAIAVESETKRQITSMEAVDTGRMRASITHRLDPSPIPKFAEVGTNVSYAVYVHEGTRAHWPPIGAVAGWAGRHGIEPFLVARAIARHGTRARPFLRQALDKARGLVQKEFSAAAREIERLWQQ